MIWVGGGIIVHGLEVKGAHLIGKAVESTAALAAQALPSSAAGAVKWTVAALLTAFAGLLVGCVSIPVVGFAIAPAWKLMKNILPKRRVTFRHD